MVKALMVLEALLLALAVVVGQVVHLAQLQVLVYMVVVALVELMESLIELVVQELYALFGLVTIASSHQRTQAISKEISWQ
jgi:hypothetical protein